MNAVGLTFVKSCVCICVGCNSKEASGESCVFDVLAICTSTEASAVIRRTSQVKAVFCTFVISCF